jgi:two-component system OmpR family response regulator
MARVSNPGDNIAEPVTAPLRGMTILIAEDDPFISRMYQTKLTLAGYDVVVVTDGRSALAYIQDHAPALAMLDLNMPELSGFEVVRALTMSNYDITRTYTLILTNSGNPNDRKTAAALGVDFIVKAEMTPQGVLDHIEQVLKK